MVRSKAYTLNRLINEVSELNGRKVTNIASLASSLSPVRGTNSAKFKVLNSFLNGKLVTISKSSSFGKTVKQRVLKALKARKVQGSDFAI